MGTDRLYETAGEWLVRSRKRKARPTRPTNPEEAAEAFFEPHQHGTDATGIPFLNEALLLIPPGGHRVVELEGSPGTGKTWTLLTLAAKFAAKTRKGRFSGRSEQLSDVDRPHKSPQRNEHQQKGHCQPRVVLVDGVNGVHLPNLVSAVRTALLRNERLDSGFELDVELKDCLERIHIIRPEGADGIVPMVESLRCQLPEAEAFPTLCLWDGFAPSASTTFQSHGDPNDVARGEVIRQVLRLLKQRNVVLVTTFVSSTYGGSHGSSSSNNSSSNKTKLSKDTFPCEA